MHQGSTLFAAGRLAASASAGCDIAVMEVADGLYQRETAALIADPWFRDRISGLVFACGDAVAAAGGVAVREAEQATGISVRRKSDLSDPAEANSFALRAGADWRRAA